MKKILALLLIMISFSGCENDDTDFIVGNWKVIKVMNDTTVYTTLTECDQTIVFHFEKNKDIRGMGPSVSSEGEICMFTGSVYKWNKINNGYVVTNPGGLVISEVAKVSKDTIMFHNLDGYPSDFKKILVRQ